ncbi:M23 family metallopeptidase [Ottowia sp. GY511]|uniref:M23 family metallopeptidase n=1 Tax=Ottowia flava TaxID=2675430 RepID=A0ABW4KVH0_9BURK|nr:M23 family metallopeptidase [Ottowia sp. GY511]TXK33306.1 M23 family metallopeptidase [Ottowia sp. GY511]
MTRSTVLIVTPHQTQSLEVDTRVLRWLKPALIGLACASTVLAIGLTAGGVHYLLARAEHQSEQSARRAEIDSLRTQVHDLKNFTSAEINAKLAALKKSEQMISDLQAYLGARGVNVKPVSIEPPKGAPNPAAGGPAVPVARPVPFTGSFVRDAGDLLQTLQSVPLGVPHDGVLSSQYGGRPNPFTGRGSESHGGLDFKGATGDPVRATARGKVTQAGWLGGYGNVVTVSHALGHSTVYAHLSRVDVKPGQHIEAGATVGLVGSTGRSTGPHLHYEVQWRGQRLDPEQYLALTAPVTAPAP